MVFKVKFTDNKPFHITFGQGILFANYPEYGGEYEFTPRAIKQTINTQDTYLTRDILFRAIPYHEVTNDQNGITAVIGGI